MKRRSESPPTVPDPAIVAANPAGYSIPPGTCARIGPAAVVPSGLLGRESFTWRFWRTPSWLLTFILCAPVGAAMLLGTVMGLIEGFEYYLTIDRQLKRSSISSTLSTLQTIVRMAVKKGVLDFYPFLGYSYERPKGEPRSITQEELEHIIDLEIEWENYRIVRDLFVFSCFSGLAISDVRNLREENIVLEEGELCIKGRRMKTKTPYRVQVLPPAWAIMERYRGKRAGFVFDVPTTDVILNGIHHIQRNIGMETPLTFHMARHTFASLITLSAGVPIETVSRMLGHTNLRTTQIYAAVSSERIHRDMQKVQQRIQDTFTLKL